MKKIIIFILVMSLTALALTACGNNNEPSPTPSPKPTESISPSPEATPTTPATPSPEPTEPDTVTPEPGDNGSALSGSLSDLVDKIYAEKDSGLRVMTLDVDLTNPDTLKSYTGLDSADKVKEAVVSEAMIGSQAYSLVLVRVNDAADVKDVADAMKEGINPAKWICVCADDLQVVTSGDVACLIMVDPELSDTVTSQEIVDAFQKVCNE